MPDDPSYGGSTTTVDFPPLVYVPVTHRPEEPGVQRLQMHTLADGRIAVFAYSALDRMADLYGDRPWVVLDVAALDRAHADTAYDVLLLDHALVRDYAAPAAPPSGELRGIFPAEGRAATIHHHEETAR